MNKWEYITFSRQGGVWSDHRNDPRSPQERLTELGKDGWELITVCYDTAGYNFYLKRALEAKKTKASLGEKPSKSKK